VLVFSKNVVEEKSQTAHTI